MDALWDDLLEGAADIAVFIYGDKKKRRRIYQLVENSKLPVFRMGGVVCARKSSLVEWIKAQETASAR
jgi:hypothetical protein